MKRPGRLILFLALTCVALGTAATAFAETILNQTIPYSAMTFNTCTDELVFVEGSLHTTMRLGTSGDRTHEGVHVQSTGVQGTTLAGARYVEMEIQNQQFNYTGLAPFEFTDERTHNLTRLGEDGSFVEGDDLRFHSIIHITVNANGILTVDKSEFSSDCR